MVDRTLDILRQDAFQQRIKGVSGGHQILWSPKDIATIRDFVMSSSAPEKLRATPAVKHNLVSTPDHAAVRRKFSNAGIVRNTQPDDLSFLFAVSSNRVDLANDVIDPAGIDCSNFNKNPAVLNAHDSSALPIAVSTPPWVSGNKLMAIAKFPQPGVNADSDMVAAAVRANLVRGASIGFIPIKWSFTSDPTRPFGVNFQSVRLSEWSCCAIPCNPDALLIGAVASGKSTMEARTLSARVEAISASQAKIAALRNEVSSAAAKIARLPDPAPLTREQRLAEAREIRRTAMASQR